MAADRLLRIRALLPACPHAEPSSSRLFEVAAQVASVSGAGIMLVAGNVNRGSSCSSNDVSASIEDLRYTLGEGPGVDAYNLDQPALEPDLADSLVMADVVTGTLAVNAFGGRRALRSLPEQGDRPT